MKFSYENIRLGDLDVEFNYINFEIICDGDNLEIKIENFKEGKKKYE